MYPLGISRLVSKGNRPYKNNLLMFLKFIFSIILYTVVSLAGEFSILFTANINGSIENCGCGPEKLGGLGRIKSFIADYTQKHKNTVVVDGGDYFNSYSFPVLNTAMLKALKTMPYDIITAGDQEFIEGESFFNRINSEVSGRILSGVSPELKTRAGNVELVFCYYLSPVIFRYREKPRFPVLPEFPTPAGNSNIVKILVFHGNLNDAEKRTRQIQFFDLVLLAHDQQKGSWKIKNTPVVGAGGDGEYVAVIKAEEQDGQWNLNIRFEKMNERWQEDQQIKAIIKNMKIYTRKDEQ